MTDKTFEEEFPRTFCMIREADESGVSGIGRVLSGVEFPDGTVVVRWESTFSSTAVYDSFEHFKAIHVDSHPSNKTKFIWFDKQRVRETIARHLIDDQGKRYLLEELGL